MDNVKLVFTNGCFDILHVGHIRYLAAAREQGDWLMVGVNSDDSFYRNKGRNAIICVAWRCEMLMSLESVDEVRIFDEDTPVNLIADVQPDVLVKGPDYTPEEVLGRSYAKKTVCLDANAKIHTSDIIEKIRQGWFPKGEN